MFNFSFGVPLVIGFHEYGRYAACFAVPATLSVFGQGLFLSLLAHDNKDAPSHYLFLFLVVTLPPLLITYTIIFDLYIAFYASAIYISLITRVFLEAHLLFSDRNTYLALSIKIELLAALLTSLSLAGATLLNYQSILLPLGLLVLTTVIFASLAIPQLQIHPRNPASISDITNTFRLLFKGFSTRLHEEGFVTLMPLFIASGSSNEVAGQFRVGLSFAKAMTKLMPYRHELVFRSIIDGHFDTTRAIRHWLIVSLAYTGLAASCLSLYERIDGAPLTGGFILLVLSGPMVAFLLLFMPAIVQISSITIYLIVICLMSCIMATVNAELFRISLTFCVTQVILTLWALKVLSTKTAEHHD